MSRDTDDSESLLILFLLYRKLRYFEKEKKKCAHKKGAKGERWRSEDKETIFKIDIVKVKDIIFVEEIVHIKKLIKGHISNIICGKSLWRVLNILSAKQDRILSHSKYLRF